jgi:hypothetical protein
VFENRGAEEVTLGKEDRRKEKTGENYSTKSFIIGTPHQK